MNWMKIAKSGCIKEILSNALITLKMAPYEDAVKRNLNDNEIKRMLRLLILSDSNLMIQMSEVRQMLLEIFIRSIMDWKSYICTVLVEMMI